MPAAWVQSCFPSIFHHQKRYILNLLRSKNISCEIQIQPAADDSVDVSWGLQGCQQWLLLTREFSRSHWDSIIPQVSIFFLSNSEWDFFLDNFQLLLVYILLSTYFPLEHNNISGNLKFSCRKDSTSLYRSRWFVGM